MPDNALWSLSSSVIKCQHPQYACPVKETHSLVKCFSHTLTPCYYHIAFSIRSILEEFQYFAIKDEPRGGRTEDVTFFIYFLADIRVWVLPFGQNLHCTEKKDCQQYDCSTYVDIAEWSGREDLIMK